MSSAPDERCHFSMESDMRDALIWVCGLLLIGTGGCRPVSVQSHTAREEFAFSVDSDGVTLVVVQARNGQVDVQGESPDGQIQVSGAKTAHGTSEEAANRELDKIAIKVARDESRPEVLNVLAVFPTNESVSGGAWFKISLPPGLDVKVTTSNGPITIKAAGDVAAQACNGSIRLENVGRTQVTATTSNAPIHATGVRGAAKIDSSNGRIHFHAADAGAVPNVRLRTSNAPVRVELPSSIQASLRLVTSNAGVTTEFRGAGVAELQRRRGTATAVLNGGGGSIEARTSNGAIDFVLTDAPHTAESRPEER